MRRACIDIGSNTTRLLVADCDARGLVECGQERAFTLIGRSLDADGAIPAAKVAEVIGVVVAQYAIARGLGAQQIRCVATAAVRRASNSGALARLISRACDGLELEILSPAQEARLAFIGAAWAQEAEDGDRLAVVDAGGGSCELVAGNAPSEVSWWVSLPLGSGDVIERWLGADPPGARELGYAGQRTRELFARVKPPPGIRRVVAVGGSATSVRAVAGPVLDVDGIDRLLEIVARVGSAELAGQFGIDQQRAALLGGGLLILRAVCELFTVSIEIGRGGLREGLLLEHQ